LPADLRLPDNVKRVQVRALGHDRIISPLNSTWDSFFLSGEGVTDDFLPERAKRKLSVKAFDASLIAGHQQHG
jgi:antitoxin VapB